MDSKYVAVIEIGSSKIKGMVAAVDATADISVLAVEETDSGDAVRYGRVQNAREVSSRVADIIRRLENSRTLTGAEISSIFVAAGGRSVNSSFAEASLSLGGETEVSPQTIERLHKDARYNLATDRDVLYIADRRFFVDNSEVKKVVGSYGNSVRGEFTIVTASPENRRNLDRVKIESHDKDVPRTYIPRAVALADMYLSDSDRQLGALLVDFGAETTTLTICRNSAIQMIATLPMGSSNITRDLSKALGITEQDAERIKTTTGYASTERLKIESSDSQEAEIVHCISARTGEIVANIINFADKAGYKIADLQAGIVVTGGGSRLNGFIEMLESQTKAKVRRIAIDSAIKSNGIDLSQNADVLALVKYAAANYDIDCVTLPEPPAEEAVTTGTYRNGRRILADDDPNLLKDDDFDQPINVNKDDDEYLDENDAGRDDPATRRKNLLGKIKGWFTTPVESNDLDEEE